MGSSCENCMRWWDHQDLNCVGNEKMRFHVVAGEDFRNYLRVPHEFGSHLRKISSVTIKLNAPNGCIYDIGVCREIGEIVLRSGWDVFATAHNLVQDDYLVFKFCGSSSFKVQIHSSHGGSEKITSSVKPHSEILEAIPPSATCDPHILNGNEMPYSGHVHTPAEFDYFTLGGSCLTKAQDKKVLEIARTIRSEIPLYVAVLNKSNADVKGSFIRIPSVLMKDVRDEFSKSTVELEGPDSNVYNVSATQQCDDEIVLQSGWDAFVVAQHIQERDLIIFRYKGNCRFEVLIIARNVFHRASSWFGMGDVSNTQEMCDDSVEIIDPPHKTNDIIDVSSSSDDENIVSAYNAKSTRHQKLQLGNFTKTRTMASTCSPSIKSVHETTEDLQSAMDLRVDQSPLNFNNCEGPSQPPYMISRKLTCPRAQEIVLQKVQAIRSRFPIYVAVLTRISTGQKPKIMRFTQEYARRCLPSASQGLTLQLEGGQSKEWETVLHVQGGHSKSRNDVTISHGWAAFASDNCLRQVDICLFELVGVMTSLKMKVHIIRKLGRRI